MSLSSVYCLFASANEAEQVGRAILDERLAACVNILAPCRSIYRWDSAIEQAEEVPAIFKTDRAMVERLIERIADLHSYDVPCITAWPVEQALASYERWARDSVARSA